MEDLKAASPSRLREIIRKGEFTGPTAGLAAGYAQANLVILPEELAFEFMLFIHRNPKPCPVLDVTDPGDPEPKLTAPGADIRQDLPKYRIYERGKLTAEVTNILKYWREDFVAFLIGCSFTFEAAFLKAGIPVRHIEEKKNVPMFITNIQCKEAGRFKGPMVVSMRPIPGRLIPKAVEITSRYKAVHGSPIHIGHPQSIGIKDINSPDFGDAVTIRKGELPVFWACGVTPQAVAMETKPSIMITHSPGHMFITDIKNEQLAEYY